MSNVRIKPEQLADTIKKELDDLAEDTTDTVKKAVQEAADTAVKELKRAGQSQKISSGQSGRNSSRESSGIQPPSAIAGTARRL